MSGETSAETVTECKFCYRPCDEMIEPRALPCDHIFCSPCIEGHYNPHNGETVCANCKVVHKGITVSNLPQAILSVQAAEEKPICDLCEGPDGAEAIRYCIDCEHQLCDEDLTFHDKQQRKSKKRAHRLVLMEEYLTSPGRYSKPYCKDHPSDELTMACAQCYRTFCVSDGPAVYQMCPKAFDGTPHEIRPLYEVGDELRDALSLQVDSLNEKVNKVNRNIKSASRGLDEAETKLDTIHGEIDQQARCLVEEVLHQAEKSKDEFDEKYKRTESSVETYMVETVQTMSVLEDLFTVGQQTVLKSHDVEILESYDDLIGELKDKVGDRSEEINFSLEPVYLNKGKPVIYTDMHPSPKPEPDDWRSHLNECMDLKSRMDKRFSHKGSLEHTMTATGAFKQTTEWLCIVYQEELERLTRGDDLKYDYQSLCDEAQKRLKGSCVDDDLRTNSFAYKWHNDLLKSECDRHITHLRLHQKHSRLEANHQTSVTEIQMLKDKIVSEARRVENERAAWIKEKQKMNAKNEAEIKRLKNNIASSVRSEELGKAAWARERQKINAESKAVIGRLKSEMAGAAWGEQYRQAAWARESHEVKAQYEAEIQNLNNQLQRVVHRGNKGNAAWTRKMEEMQWINADIKRQLRNERALRSKSEQKVEKYQTKYKKSKRRVKELEDSSDSSDY